MDRQGITKHARVCRVNTVIPFTKDRKGHEERRQVWRVHAISRRVNGANPPLFVSLVIFCQRNRDFALCLAWRHCGRRHIGFCGVVAFEKHLLVDGSNLLHAWPELRLLEKRDRDAARSRLSKRLRVLHDFEGFRVTLVFDGKGSEIAVEHPSGQDTFTHIFTPTHLTADDVIEHMVGQSASPAQCWVATDDRAERHTVDAVGGTSLSAGELAEWVVRIEARQQAKLAGLHEQNTKEWRRKKQ